MIIFIFRKAPAIQRIRSSFVTILLLLLCSGTLRGQSYRLFTFTDEQGLTSNLVKKIVQDSTGFIWAGTDGGVVLYDSREFVSVNNGLPSIYVKDILRTSKNEIIAVTDLGVGYIRKTATGWNYVELLRGSTKTNDTTLCFPKGIFEDKSGILWIADQNGIIRIKDGVSRKYPFAAKFKTDSYFRSFLFVEDDDNNLLVSSWQGYLFRYNRTADRFEQIPYEPAKTQSYINAIKVTARYTLLIGTKYGLSEIHYAPDFSKCETRLILNLAELSSFQKDPDGNYIIGTWTNGAFIWTPSTNSVKKVTGLEARTVNNIVKDREGAFWLSTDDGIAILKKTAFAQAEINRDNLSPGSTYIRNLVTDEKGDVYFSDQEIIYKVVKDHQNYSYNRIHSSHGKRVYNFDVYKGNLWVSYRNGELYVQGINQSKTFTTNEIGGRLSILELDRDGVCWGFVEQANKVVRIDNHFRITFFPFPENANSSQLLKVTRNGEIYFLYADQTFHLYKFNRQHQFFEPISFVSHHQFQDLVLLFDISITPENNIYIASSKGLYQIANDALADISPKLTGESTVFKAICLDKDQRLWIGTEKELLLKIGRETIPFNQKDGLPNSAITPRGIIFDQRGKLWVATPSGVAYWQTPEEEIKQTMAPIVTGIRVNSVMLYDPLKSTEFQGSTNIDIYFTSISYPNRVNYQTRLLGIKDEWSEFSAENKIDFFKLPAGDYIFQVRAQQAGQLLSNVTEYRFSILPHWYVRWWMLVLYFICLLICLSWFINYLQKKRIQWVENENRKLESIVTEKTSALVAEKETTELLLEQTQGAKKELERTNTDLRKVNEIKNDLLSITAHDLKNPLSSIMAYSQIILEDDLPVQQIRKFTDIIHHSALNMLSIITQLLDSVVLESTNFRMELTRINLREMIERIIALNTPQLQTKNQKLIFEPGDAVEAKVDPKWMREAIDNLVSNAIKYSPFDKTITIRLIKELGHIKISVQDEGPGLTEADQQFMFGKFRRLSAKPTGGESSTGLGLSIVKEVVTMHNGIVYTESELGKGSTFILEFPVEPLQRLQTTKNLT